MIGQAAAVRERAILAISLLDLTSLSDDDTEARIARLCERAAAPAPGVRPAAAVCVLPRFVRSARRALSGSGAAVAAAAGDFPSGLAPLSDRLDEVRRAVADGADEIDAPATFVRNPDAAAAREIAAIREACGGAVLKVILETGALGSAERIRRAAEAAIAAGADFLKTSTGKVAPGATPGAVRVLLECAAGAGRTVGVKVSGGIRTRADAFGYMDLAEEILGPGALEPSRFRIGASALLDDLVRAAVSGADPRGRFSGRVDAYVRSRPGYPPGLIPLLEREAGLEPSHTVADVGSGTGILTRLFLDHGNEVYAVEPNAKMRAAAETAFEAIPLFRSVEGSAEATTLPSESIDLVAAGQAFHWFDREAARAEFARILRPPRTVVLVWNDRRTEGSAFSRGYEELLRRHGTDYGAVDHKNLGPDVFEAFFRPGPWNRFALPNRQTFDAEGLRARVLSSSYTPPPGDPRHAPMLEDLGRLFEETAEDDAVTMEYDTTVYIGAVTR